MQQNNGMSFVVFEEELLAMTSNFVRQIHQATCQRLLEKGCSEQQLREHLRNVWLSEEEIQRMLADLALESESATTPAAEVV